MKTKSLIFVVFLCTTAFAVIPQKNCMGASYAYSGVAIGVREPYGTYQVNSSIPISLNLKLIFGTTIEQPFYKGIISQELRCKCSIDNNTNWIEVPFEKVTRNTTQPDLNYPFINIVYCTYSTNVTGVSVGFHTLNVVSYPISAWVVTAEPPGVALDDVVLSPSPVTFTIVGQPTPTLTSTVSTPTATVPEFSAIVILPLFAVLAFTAIVILRNKRLHKSL